jgi:hypothetical protein
MLSREYPRAVAHRHTSDQSASTVLFKPRQLRGVTVLWRAVLMFLAAFMPWILAGFQLSAQDMPQSSRPEVSLELEAICICNQQKQAFQEAELAMKPPADLGPSTTENPGKKSA